MKHFKTIALALAISTGACTVQATPQTRVRQIEIGPRLSKWLSVTAAGALAYWTATRVTWEPCENYLVRCFIERMNAKLGKDWRNAPDAAEALSNARQKFRDELQPLFYICQALTGSAAFAAYGMLLHRAIN